MNVQEKSSPDVNFIFTPIGSAHLTAFMEREYAVDMDVRQFITELGGTSEAAKIFGVTPPAVSNWKAVNRLPDRLHLRALRVADEKKLEFDPEQDAA